MTIDKSKFFKKVASILGVITMTVCVGCGEDTNGQSQNGGGSGRTVTLTGTVRSARFAPVKADIFYDGKNVGVSKDDGTFEVTVPERAGGNYDSVLGVGNSFTRSYYQNNQQTIEIIVLEDGMTYNDFYMFSGKIVLHSDGETVASGTTMKIDGNTVLTVSDNRNFDVGPVYKDSVITWTNEQGTFLDGKFLPLESCTFAQGFSEIADTTEQYINGEKVTLKHVVGYTVRLNNVN